MRTTDQLLALADPTVAFVAMTSDDLNDYDRVIAGMNPEDTYSPVTFFGKLAAGRMYAWWAVVDGVRVGWCALAPRDSTFAPGAWHLYGSWVEPSHRRRGIARMMWLFRLRLLARLHPGAPASVSIMPGKDGSLTIANDLGFVHKPEAVSPPWDTYIADPAGPPSVLTAVDLNDPRWPKGWPDNLPLPA